MGVIPPATRLRVSINTLACTDLNNLSRYSNAQLWIILLLPSLLLPIRVCVTRLAPTIPFVSHYPWRRPRRGYRRMGQQTDHLRPTNPSSRSSRIQTLLDMDNRQKMSQHVEDSYYASPHLTTHSHCSQIATLCRGHPHRKMCGER